MKILQIVHSFPPQNMAGTEVYTYNLSKELSKKNEIFVFYRICDLKRREYELNEGKFEGLNVITVNNTFRLCDSFEKFYRNDDITDQFAKVLDKVKPDIVHIQHLIFLSTTIIDEIKRRRIPIVLTLHDYWLICPQWHFLKKDLSVCNNSDLTECVNCLDYQMSIKKFPKIVYSIFRNIMPDFIICFFKNIYLNLARATLDSQETLENIKLRIMHIKELCLMIDLFIAPSQSLRKKFIGFGIPEDKIKFIPYGINIESFKNFKRKPSDRIRFGFIGTILPAKGVDILIKAFNEIRDNRVELKIYGKLFPYNGFEYYPRYIKRLAKNGNIRFMGGFDHKDISDVFSEIDALVFPSVWNENCPLTILEAFLTGTPVIASRIGGIPELIKDKENGLLFEPRNPYDLCDKIKIFINTPSLIERLKMDINQPKNIEENTQEIEELYKELIKQ